MAQEIPLKKEVDEALQLIDRVHKEYQKYFMGLEKLPPFTVRKELDTKITFLKSKIATSPSTSLKFLANSATSKYQIYVVQWEKTLKEIENGTFRRPVLKKGGGGASGI